MSLLTDEDYAEWRASYSKYGMMNEAMARAAFKAAEAAVIARLATVSVEPVLVTSKLGELCTFSSLSVNKGDKLVPVEALAAVRVQSDALLRQAFEALTREACAHTEMTAQKAAWTAIKQHLGEV